MPAQRQTGGSREGGALITLKFKAWGEEKGRGTEESKSLRPGKGRRAFCRNISRVHSTVGENEILYRKEDEEKTTILQRQGIVMCKASHSY